MRKYLIIAAAAFIVITATAALIAAASSGKITIRSFLKFWGRAAAVLLAIVVPFIGGALFALLKYGKNYK